MKAFGLDVNIWISNIDSAISEKILLISKSLGKDWVNRIVITASEYVLNANIVIDLGQNSDPEIPKPLTQQTTKNNKKETKSSDSEEKFQENSKVANKNLTVRRSFEKHFIYDQPFNKKINCDLPRITNWKNWKLDFNLDQIPSTENSLNIPFFIHGSEGNCSSFF